MPARRKERRDSEGVRRALTASRLEWAAGAKVVGTQGSTGHVTKTEPCDPATYSSAELDTWRMHRAHADNHRDTQDRSTNVKNASGRLGGYEGSELKSDEAADGSVAAWVRNDRSSDSNWNTARLSVITSTPAPDSPAATMDGLLLPCNQVFPAAGQQRGRDYMSSRRSCLTGAGVGVLNEVVTESGCSGASSVGAERWRGSQCTGKKHSSESLVTNAGLDNRGQESPGNANDRSLAAVDLSEIYDENLKLKDREFVSPNSSRMAVDARGRDGGPAGLAADAIGIAKLSLADMIGVREGVAEIRNIKNEDCCRNDRASVPFATDAIEEELRPQRELERQPMVLQMEASQVKTSRS